MKGFIGKARLLSYQVATFMFFQITKICPVQSLVKYLKENHFDIETCLIVLKENIKEDERKLFTLQYLLGLPFMAQ